MRTVSKIKNQTVGIFGVANHICAVCIHRSGSKHRFIRSKIIIFEDMLWEDIIVEEANILFCWVSKTYLECSVRIFGNNKISIDIECIDISFIITNNFIIGKENIIDRYRSPIRPDRSFFERNGIILGIACTHTTQIFCLGISLGMETTIK